MLGFFCYLRDHIYNFAEVAKPLTDMASKSKRFKPHIPWEAPQQEAFDELKRFLKKATEETSVQLSMNRSIFSLMPVFILCPVP